MGATTRGIVGDGLSLVQHIANGNQLCSDHFPPLMGFHVASHAFFGHGPEVLEQRSSMAKNRSKARETPFRSTFCNEEMGCPVLIDSLVFFGLFMYLSIYFSNYLMFLSIYLLIYLYVSISAQITGTPAEVTRLVRET